ncbi:MAG: DUF5050 domain-containing protein [Lachnospiraceae bacterium]|nr:DUF5050 domain-containing protein [Lachnospiraceae bacterium]
MKRFCKYGLFFVGIFVLCLVVSLLFRKSDDVQEESSPDYPYTNLETDERISFPPMEMGGNIFSFYQLQQEKEAVDAFYNMLASCDFKGGLSYKAGETAGDFVCLDSVRGEDIYAKFLSLNIGDIKRIMDLLCFHEKVSYPLECAMFTDVESRLEMYRIRANIKGTNTLDIYLVNDSDVNFDMSFLGEDGERNPQISFLYEQRMYQNHHTALEYCETEEHFVYFYPMQIDSWQLILVFDTNYTVLGENRNAVGGLVVGQLGCRECFCDILAACRNLKEEEPVMTPYPGPGPGVAPYSAEICVSGEWLYYCGSDIDSGLYAYNLETKEKVQITEEQGKPSKTPNGIFYNVGGKIYGIQGLTLEFLCQLPRGAVLVDYDQEKVYWVEGMETLYEGKPDAEKTVEKEDAKVLHQISPGEKPILRARIYGEKAYVERMDGLYLVDIPTMETECILEEEISPIASSLEGDSLLVKVKSSDKGLYMVFLEDSTVQKLDGPNVNFALLHDGIVYYNGNGIRSYDLKDGSVKTLSKEGYQDRGGSYAGVAFYDHSLVLRCEFYYEIYLFDIESGEIECIISQE